MEIEDEIRDLKCRLDSVEVRLFQVERRFVPPRCGSLREQLLARILEDERNFNALLARLDQLKARLDQLVDSMPRLVGEELHKLLDARK